MVPLLAAISLAPDLDRKIGTPAHRAARRVRARDEGIVREDARGGYARAEEPLVAPLTALRQAGAGPQAQCANDRSTPSHSRLEIKRSASPSWVEMASVMPGARAPSHFSAISCDLLTILSEPERRISSETAAAGFRSWT